jgi:hypothetical protein
MGIPTGRPPRGHAKIDLKAAGTGALAIAARLRGRR